MTNEDWVSLVDEMRAVYEQYGKPLEAAERWANSACLRAKENTSSDER